MAGRQSSARVVASICWQPQTVRGAFAGAPKKTRLTVTSEKVGGTARVYRIARAKVCT